MTDNARPGGHMQLAGERMVLTESDDGSTTWSFDDKGTGRVCGSCTLCCKLVPVAEIRKAGGERCRYLKAGSKAGGGCRIYAERPDSCRVWHCRWLSDRSTAGMPRPDRVHYVIDSLLDKLKMKHDEHQEYSMVSALQVWVDPAFPNAWKDAACMAYIERHAERFRSPTLIRTPPDRVTLVFAPCISADNKWHFLDDAKADRTDGPGTGEQVRLTFQPEPGDIG